ncbi:hypothetical protein MXD81_52620 [Microbacteriaceae bacterium K1510]|nr:hypothetical protein [Microbacteriaceae bacterium K1510]
MVALRALIIAVCLLGVMPAVAAESSAFRGACLTKAEQRAAVAAHKAVPLAEVIKNLRAKGHRGEVVRARLCRRGEGLDYVLTLLARNGKVVSLTVDAANGELINGR